MDTEIFKLFFSDYLMGIWLLFNFIFLTFGFAFGAYFFSKRGANKGYQKGLTAAKEEFKAKNEIFSSEVTSKLSELKTGILQSALAYQEAVKVIESHLEIGGEIGESLQLNSEQRPLIENQNFVEVQAEDIDITDTAEFKKVVGA